MLLFYSFKLLKNVKLLHTLEPQLDKEMMPVDMAVSFFDDNHTRLEFIGGVDEKGFADGPFWVSRGYSAASSFTNGFLYGHMDPQGRTTGVEL